MAEQGSLLSCDAVRWADPDAIPPWVEVALVDAEGRTWLFHDKVPIFAWDNEPTSSTTFPMKTAIRVHVLDRGEFVRVSTDPDGVESTEGVREFVVRADQLRA